MSVLSNRRARAWWWSGRRAVVAVLAAAALLALASYSGGGLSAPGVLAQEVRAPEMPGITVIGDGVATARPDTTTIQLGVQVTAPTPAEALNQTRAQTQQVLQRLRERGVAETDIQTSGLNVFPIQDQTKAGPPDPTNITGYRGDATITVQVQDVAQVGALLDAAVQAGATAVRGLSFGIKDDAELRRKAMVDAIAVARPKA
ncbi:MAG: SIMPL domain-containing protein, partial [Chloroflexota bacterium]